MQLSRKGDTSSEDLAAVAADVGRAMASLFRAAGRAKALDAASGGDFHAIPVLFVLREKGPMRSNELADLLFADPSTISRQVANLVEQQYVERQVDPVDRRASLLAVTPLGSSVLDARLAVRQRMLASMLADWPPRDRRRLAVLLGRFADQFASHTAAPADIETDRTNRAEPA